MKTLKNYCTANNLVLIPIRYKHQFGYQKRKGFDICKANGEILVSFEPSYGTEKWYLRHTYDGYIGPRYINRITPKFLSSIDVNGKSFILNSAVNK